MGFDSKNDFSADATSVTRIGDENDSDHIHSDCKVRIDFWACIPHKRLLRTILMRLPTSRPVENSPALSFPV